MKDISFKWKSKEEVSYMSSDKTDFKSETVTRDKGVHDIMIKD